MTDFADQLEVVAADDQVTATAGHFGPRLRLARKERGWTLKDLSVASGISVTYLSDLERGKLQNPTLDTITSLASSMGMSMNALLGIRDTKSGDQELPRALEDFCQSEGFVEAVAADSERLKVPPQLLAEEWKRLLAGIRVVNRVPAEPSDYEFLFQAAKRILF